MDYSNSLRLYNMDPVRLSSIFPLYSPASGKSNPKLVQPDQIVGKPVSILDLPPEVILKIFKHLHEIIPSCACHWKKFHDNHA